MVNNEIISDVHNLTLSTRDVRGCPSVLVFLFYIVLLRHGDGFRMGLMCPNYDNVCLLTASRSSFSRTQSLYPPKRLYFYLLCGALKMTNLTMTDLT